ncbi:zf-HC2 domain-containing protein [Streptomyces sp. NPDC000594]|uniref:zf-HC2 domain-containing protein n=1 Tax=Streptomyces sp. NPDC000594 TaxID=3154261 RepID=UPI00331D6506
MSDWHVTDGLALRYADGSVAEPDAWSLEKHIEGCGGCAARVSAAVRRGPAGPELDLIRAALLDGARTSAPSRTAPAPGRAASSRMAGRAARIAWAAGPAVRGAWPLALAAVIGVALLLAYGMGSPAARPLLLALSPVMPLLGVALSYGRYADPLHEITASTPSGGLRLLLTRAAVVLLVSLPLTAAAGALLPTLPADAAVPGPALWLLPGLALTLAALALGSFVGCGRAATGLACGWLLLVGPLLGPVPRRVTEEVTGLIAGPAAQAGWAVAALLSAGLLILRRSSFDRLETV